MSKVEVVEGFPDGDEIEGMAHEYELWQGGIMVAMAGSDDEDAARREIWHYAMMYAQDGPVEIKSPTKSDIRPPAA